MLRYIPQYLLLMVPGARVPEIERIVPKSSNYCISVEMLSPLCYICAMSSLGSDSDRRCWTRQILQLSDRRPRAAWHVPATGVAFNLSAIFYVSGAGQSRAESSPNFQKKKTRKEFKDAGFYCVRTAHPRKLKTGPIM